MAREYDRESIPKHRYNKLLDCGHLWSVTTSATFTIAQMCSNVLVLDIIFAVTLMQKKVSIN